MPCHRDNFLLNLLEPDMLDQIEPQLSIIDLRREQVLAETHARIESVYFPHSGIISCVVELIGGGTIETGMIGKDGVFGASQALDDKVSLNHVVTQLAGTASLMTSDQCPSPYLQVALADAWTCWFRSAINAGIPGANDGGPAHHRDDSSR